MQKTQLMFPAEIRGIKATRIGEFVRNGERRYRYAITGTPAALAAWKKARGQYYLEDEVTKQVIFIAIPSVALELVKAGGKMLISTNGSVRPDYDSLEDLMEDEMLYKQAYATAKAQADVAMQRGNRTFGAGRTASARTNSVPDQNTINENVGGEDLSNPANASLTHEDDLTPEERAALEGSAAGATA